MNRERAKVEIKGKLEDYLRQKGINTRKNFSCLNPAHRDSNPSMSFDAGRNKAHCFSCGADYDTLDVIGLEYGLTSPADIFQKAHEIFRMNIDGSPEYSIHIEKPGNNSILKAEQSEKPKPDLTEYFKKCQERVEQTNYFHKRGLSDEIISRYCLGYDTEFKTKDDITKQYITWQAVVIPTGKYSCTVRNTNGTGKDNRLRKRGTSPVYNRKALYSGKPVFIVEGELDALSIIEVGGEAVALGSTANIRQFIKIVKDKAPSDTLIISLDNDEDGQQTADKIAKELDTLNIPFIKANIAGEYKDANEALTADRNLFLQAVNESQANIEEQQQAEQDIEKEEYLKNSTAHHIQSFINGIGESVNTPCIPTGFDNLDRMLDGGLYEGLYILGAISSLGKTTFILQVADNIAKQGEHVLIFSLEMARTELMAKSISRETWLLCEDTRDAKTVRGITAGRRYAGYSAREKDLIQESIKRYGEYSQNIFITEALEDVGVNEVRETVNKHLQFTGKKPVIIIDYLQILAPYDMRSTDKQNTDKAVKALKGISRDFKIPVIAISSFNRENYNTPVSMVSFKESGAIEYSSDVLMALQFQRMKELEGKERLDIDAEKGKNPREIALEILKNRNGQTSQTGTFKYYPFFNYFEETNSANEEAQRIFNSRGRKSKGYNIEVAPNGQVLRATEKRG